MATILIVDDSPTQIANMTKMLEKNGHSVITAENGEEGVEVAIKEIPDLVLMDVVMPKLNGFKATRKITRNESTQHIPIILVTTKDMQTDKVWGERQGAKGYIVKPPNEKDLMTMINDLLSE